MSPHTDSIECGCCGLVFDATLNSWRTGAIFTCPGCKHEHQLVSEDA
jgi:transposase